MPEIPIPTSVLAIVGTIVVMVLTTAGLIVRGVLSSMAEQAKTDRDIRTRQAEDTAEAMRSIQGAVLQVAGFMSTQTEQLRVIQSELIRAALREPLAREVIIANPLPVPVKVLEPVPVPVKIQEAVEKAVAAEKARKTGKRGR